MNTTIQAPVQVKTVAQVVRDTVCEATGFDKYEICNLPEAKRAKLILLAMYEKYAGHRNCDSMVYMNYRTNAAVVKARGRFEELLQTDSSFREAHDIINEFLTSKIY